MHVGHTSLYMQNVPDSCFQEKSLNFGDLHECSFMCNYYISGNHSYDSQTKNNHGYQLKIVDI